MHCPSKHWLQPGGQRRHFLFCNQNPSGQSKQLLGFLGSHLPLQLETHLIHLPVGDKANPGKQFVHILVLSAEHIKHPC